MKKLKLSEYQDLAQRTSGAGGNGERRLIIAALGLAGEAGEFANMVKKLTAHGHDISPETLADEAPGGLRTGNTAFTGQSALDK